MHARTALTTHGLTDKDLIDRFNPALDSSCAQLGDLRLGACPLAAASEVGASSNGRGNPGPRSPLTGG
jgi:hypothetical protein